jgi:long-chain fatty acid transport protein
MKKDNIQPWIKTTAGVVFFWAITACLMLPVRSGAVGFRLPNQDPEAIARGDAFAATADNPSAIYYNPAGITQMQGWNLRAGIYAISPGVDYKSPSGTRASVNSDFQPVPQFYFVYSPTNLPVSFGLGTYAPYGLSADWGNNNPFRTVAESGQLLYLSINPVIAWRITSKLSIGIGPTINYSQVTLKQGIFAPGDEFKFKGDGWGYGFNAGILWQPHPKWSFGVNYRNGTDIKYEGSSHFSPYVPFSTSTSGTLHFPQFVVGGISFRPTTNWNLEFDLDWTDWNSVKQAAFNGTAIPIPPLMFDYTSGFIYDFGVTRQLGRGYFISTGYIYAENSSPDKNFSPLIADSNLQLGSIGFGHHGRYIDWALAYHFGYNGGRTVQNDNNALADGTYKTFNNAFNAAVTYKF